MESTKMEGIKSGGTNRCDHFLTARVYEQSCLSGRDHVKAPIDSEVKYSKFSGYPKRRELH